MSTELNFLDQVSIAFSQPSTQAHLVVGALAIVFLIGMKFYSELEHRKFIHASSGK